MKHNIHVEEDIQKLIGEGEEWLVNGNGEIIAVFLDGNLSNRNYNNTSNTLSL